MSQCFKNYISAITWFNDVHKYFAFYSVKMIRNHFMIEKINFPESYTHNYHLVYISV